MINIAKLEVCYLRYNKIKKQEYLVLYEEIKTIKEVFVFNLEIKLNKADKKNQNSKKLVKWYRILINFF